MRKRSKAQEQLYQNIEIDLNLTVPVTGEVPSSWLRGFKEFQTWHDFRYKCKGHCSNQFADFHSVINHHQEEVPVKDQSIDCHICFKSFHNQRIYKISYINHMVKHHFEHLKFCCIVCSQVFYNVQFLSRHYQDQHPDIVLGKMYPCLSCGMICQSSAHLERHIQMHKKN